jgi:hypothetical protein
MQTQPITIERAAPHTRAPTAIDTAVARMDAWLDTMRGADGYGGPVAHWWRQSLLYTGVGRDWRYEGIIDGYLLLWERSGDGRWLAKAVGAADDLLAGQLANGHFAASCFEINPAAAGTPHEAAADVGLLLLALALRAAGRPDAERYAAGALRNMHAFYLGQLWDEQAQSFRDDPRVPSFVPNKAATACDALFLLADLTGDSGWVERYALPNARRILMHQVRGGPLAGAIAQNSFGQRVVEKYFPIYIARCVPALLRAYHWSNEGQFAEGALAAMRFVARWLGPDGAIPTAIYANGRASRGPSWVAPLGDVLRAAAALRPLGFAADFSACEARLLAGQDATGGIQTATGFALQAGGRAPALPDLRDVLHVVGWCDKAFRYLAAQSSGVLPASASAPFSAECMLNGQRFTLNEMPDALELRQRGTLAYQWRKGAPWAHTRHPAFWLN